MFTDLNLLISTLTSKGVDARLEELASKFGSLPTAAIYAVGGFPIKLQAGNLTWLNNPTHNIKNAVKDGLGASALLTYVNPNNKLYGELGQVCLEKGHSWAYHWMTVSMVLVNYPLLVEMSFAHDTRFQLSWAIQNNPTGKVVGVTGSIKNWLAYTKHYTDGSFDLATRKAMAETRSILVRDILPLEDTEASNKLYDAYKSIKDYP